MLSHAFENGSTPVRLGSWPFKGSRSSKMTKGQFYHHLLRLKSSARTDLLKGFTAHMAEQGVIVTRLLPPIQKSVIAFYELMERDVSSDQAKTVCHQVAKSLKKMLRVIRSKWQRWEMPRVPQLPTMTSSFPICLQCCTCCPKYLV